MKNSNVLSAVSGGIFFAVPYLALSVPIVPSLLIGSAAFCAGELVFRKNNIQIKSNTDNDFQKIIKNAKKENKKLLEIVSCIEDEKIKENLRSIHLTVEKIIISVEEDPTKRKISNFFDYYLPVIVKIGERYENIEDQKLSSKDSKDFYESTKKMLIEAKKAFENILNRLYESDMINTDVEMKVLNTMLKADGLTGKEIEIEEDNHES